MLSVDFTFPTGTIASKDNFFPLFQVQGTFGQEGYLVADHEIRIGNRCRNGVDERVHQRLVTDEISIGDYVLSGGEVPAMVLVEAITRLIPGVYLNRKEYSGYWISSLKYPRFHPMYH